MTEMVAGISKAAVAREAAMMEASSNFIWARKLRALRAALDRAEAERDARIDPAEVQALINAAEPMLAEALAAAEAERDRLRAAIMFWLAAQEPDVDAAINMMRAALKGEKA